ncbi:hypothetical protein ACP4OV_029915 [Aristida adscensionis]
MQIDLPFSLSLAAWVGDDRRRLGFGCRSIHLPSRTRRVHLPRRSAARACLEQSCRRKSRGSRKEEEMGDAGTAVAVAFTAALAVLFVVLLGAVLHRLWRRRREPAASSSRGFVLFDVCFQDDMRQRRAVRPSMERERARWEHAPGEGPDEQAEPDECEIARWKKMFGGPARSLSTIDEGTEKGTPITTPAFCSPPASPDRRDARALEMGTIAVQVKA